MAKITNSPGIPGISTGILMPKVSNRFRVRFENITDAEGNPLKSDISYLSAQTISVTRPKIYFPPKCKQRKTVLIAGGDANTPVVNYEDTNELDHDPIFVTLEQDAGGMVDSIVSDIVAAQTISKSNSFKVIIESLNGNNEVMDLWTLFNARVCSVEFSELNYAKSDPSNVILGIKFNEAKQTLFVASEANK